MEYWIKHEIKHRKEQKIEYKIDVFRHKIIQIGVFAQMRYWPLSALYGEPLHWKRDENCKLYCLSPNLMADMFRQLPQLLLEPRMMMRKMND